MTRPDFLNDLLFDSKTELNSGQKLKITPSGVRIIKFSAFQLCLGPEVDFVVSLISFMQRSMEFIFQKLPARYSSHNQSLLVTHVLS